MRLSFLISDHGWGHLGRSLVVAAEVVARGHDLQLVVSPAMATRVRDAVPGAAVCVGRLDQGYIFGAGGRGADAAASRALLSACSAGPTPELTAEVVAWRPDVVLADATPWATVVARACGVPAVLASNFSWDDQYAGLFEGDSEAAPDVATVRAQASMFDLALEMPLGPGAPSVRTRRSVPLVGQRPAGRATGLPTDRPLITWAFGRTLPAAQPLTGLGALATLAKERGFALVVNELLRDIARDLAPEAILLPDDAPWPDVLATSRIVVSKAGYSTIAEALRGAGHVIATGVTGLPEERAMQHDIEARGLGRGVPVDVEDVAAAIADAARSLINQPERAPLDEAGEVEIVDALEEIARHG